MLAETGGEHGGREKNVYQRTGKLPQKHPPQRLPRLLGQNVGTVRDKAARGLLLS